MSHHETTVWEYDVAAHFAREITCRDEVAMTEVCREMVASWYQEKESEAEAEDWSVHCWMRSSRPPRHGVCDITGRIDFQIVTVYLRLYKD